MPLDEDDLGKIGELIAAALKTNNEQVTMPAIKTAVTEAGKGALSEEQVRKLIDDRVPTPGPGPADDPPGDDDDDPRWARMQQQIEQATKKAEAAEKARLEAEEARQNERRNALVREALTEAGIDPKHMSKAMSDLRDTQRIQVLDDGTLVYRTKGDYGDVDYDLDKGLTKYLETDGAVFAPADGGGGTGDNPGARTRTRGGRREVSMQELQAIVQQRFMQPGG